MALTIKRAYEEPSDDDGYRVLVDRLWPRGLSKQRAAIDLWLKDIAPSPELRRWWNHDPALMDEFATRYRAELDHNPAVAELRTLLEDKSAITLVYGARDTWVNHARVLKEYVSETSPQQ